VIFSNLDTKAKEFYRDKGYLQLRINDQEFKQSIKNLKLYYETADPGEGSKAFRSADGSPKQFVNIFRDPNSDAYNLYNTPIIKKLISAFTEGPAIFTNAKLSFKIPHKQADFFFHQDNGYNSKSDQRSGYAIFICLEAMNEKNGCLKIVPESHQLGTLQHNRKIEHAGTGDNQLVLSDLPNSLDVVSIEGEQGDIVIFHSDTIHGSGSSTVDSKRLAVICEVETYKSPKLDDYGHLPIFAMGQLPLPHKLTLASIRYINPLAVWFLIKKKFPLLAKLIRRMRY